MSSGLRVGCIGRGALGSMYSAYLADAGVDVTLISQSTSGTHAYTLQRQKAAQAASYALPVVTAAPDSVNLLLLAVRTEQLSAEFFSRLRVDPKTPLLSLTPLFAREHALIQASFEGRVIEAMPSLAGHFVGSVLHSFVAPLTPTWVDDSGRAQPAIVELVSALSAARLSTRFGPGVGPRNQATTVAFFPLCLALFLAGSANALIQDKALLRLTQTASREALELAQQLGPIDQGVLWLTRAIHPAALRVLCSLGRAYDPELIRFFEDHFARKLGAQHLILGQQVATLFAEHAVLAPGYQEIFARVRARG